LKQVYGLFAAICLSLLITGCANSLNQATANRYAAACADAELSGRLEVAEKACSRELDNADWGNLGAEQKSQKLYNLARIKRQLSKFSEAEDLLRVSLAIEERLSPPSPVRIGRRLVELAVNCAAQNRWDRGVYYMDRALPFAPELSGQERKYLSLVLTQYARKLREWNQTVLAERYETASAGLQ
jgi:hypothetical protein